MAHVTRRQRKLRARRVQNALANGHTFFGNLGASGRAALLPARSAQPVIVAAIPSFLELLIGPFRCGVMPAVGSNKGKSYWFVEGELTYGDLAGGYEPDHAGAARSIERMLTHIELSIQEARGA
jgi:hypothetical protein